MQMNNITLASRESAVTCEFTDASICGNIFVDENGIPVLSAQEDVLARTLYLRAVAAFAIAKGYVIAVAGNISAPCLLSLTTSCVSDAPEQLS